MTLGTIVRSNFATRFDPPALCQNVALWIPPILQRNEHCFFGSTTKGELCYAALDPQIDTCPDPFASDNYFPRFSHPRRRPELVRAAALDAFACLRSNLTTRLLASDVAPHVTGYSVFIAANDCRIVFRHLK